jgi:transposase
MILWFPQDVVADRKWSYEMGYGHSLDLRRRIIEAVEAGASAREAARRFDVSPSSAIKLVQRWRGDREL